MSAESLAKKSGSKRSALKLPLSVAAVVLAWNEAELTCSCVAAIKSQVDHVYVIDNNSRPPEARRIAGLEDEDVTVIVNARNLGYAAGCTRGFEAALQAGFDAVLVLNNDAFPDNGSVGRLADRLDEAPWVGAVGPAVVQHKTREVLHVACSLNPRTARASWAQRGISLGSLSGAPKLTDYLSGEAVLFRREALEMVGMFDSRYFCYYEDVDWSLRARRAGWALEVVPQAVFEHMVSTSSVGQVGIYYRARNHPLCLRIALGRTSIAALALSAPSALRSIASLIRGGQLKLAARGAFAGWIVGSFMRI